MNKTTYKAHVVLALPKPVPLLISLARAIEAAVSAATKTFASPTPTMAQLGANIASLEAAQSAAHLRTKGAVATRDARVAVLKTDLQMLRSYVQTVADADPTTAATVVHAAGMTLRKASSYTKPPLAAKATSSGVIVVSAKLASARQANHWQLSTDGGTTWIDLPETLQTKTTVTGLPPGQTVLVRHVAVTKDGAGTWSDPVSVLVH